jgi:hypothetical protein
MKINNQIINESVHNALRSLSYIAENLSAENVTPEFKELYKKIKSDMNELMEKGRDLKQDKFIWELTYSSFEKSQYREGLGSFYIEVDGEEACYEDVTYYPRDGQIYANDIKTAIEEYPEGMEALTDEDFEMIANLCTSAME